MIRRYLLDTGIAQDFQEGRHGVPERVQAARRQGHKIGICTPVLGELWSGVEGGERRDVNEARLRHALARFIIWPYSAEAAAEYGRIFMELRRAGRPMQQIDIQIGAIAHTIPHCVVVTKDSDLQAIAGLTLENWAS